MKMGFRFSQKEFLKFIWKKLAVRFVLVGGVAFAATSHFFGMNVRTAAASAALGAAAALFKYNQEVELRSDTAILITVNEEHPEKSMLTVGKFIGKNSPDTEVYRDIHKICNFKTVAITSTYAVIKGNEIIPTRGGDPIVSPQEQTFQVPFTYMHKRDMIEMLRKFNADPDTPIMF